MGSESNRRTDFLHDFGGIVLNLSEANYSKIWENLAALDRAIAFLGRSKGQVYGRLTEVDKREIEEKIREIRRNSGATQPHDKIADYLKNFLETRKGMQGVWS